MTILCKLFGHKRNAGWWGDGLYGSVHTIGADNTGRTHFHVRLKCDRCGESYVAARFHGHQFDALRARASQDSES
jgi:hypothetical protein